MSLRLRDFSILINVVFFQAIWFITVIAAAYGSWWPGLVGLAAFMTVHFFVSPTASADFILALCAVVMGFACETVFIRTGLLVYPLAGVSVIGVPVWILILWANFALIMNGCLSWLQGRYVLAAVLGFAGGPLSYFGGLKLGAAMTGDSLATVLLVIAACYAVITPLLLFLAQWLAETRSA